MTEGDGFTCPCNRASLETWSRQGCFLEGLALELGVEGAPCCAEETAGVGRGHPGPDPPSRETQMVLFQAAGRLPVLGREDAGRALCKCTGPCAGDATVLTVRAECSVNGAGTSTGPILESLQGLGF